MVAMRPTPLLLELSPKPVEVLTEAVADRLDTLANDRLKLEGALAEPEEHRAIPVTTADLTNVVEEDRILREILERLERP